MQNGHRKLIRLLARQGAHEFVDGFNAATDYAGAVYLAETDNKLIKAGYASNGASSRISRIKSVYSGKYSFEEVRAFAWIVHPFAQVIESIVHDYLREFFVGGEWYSLPPWQAFEALSKAVLDFENELLKEGLNITSGEVAS